METIEERVDDLDDAYIKLTSFDGRVTTILESHSERMAELKAL